MSLLCKLKTLFKYGFITKNIDDNLAYPIDQIKSFGKTGYAWIVMPYGLNSKPPPQTECLVLNVNSDENNKIAIPTSTADRFKGLVAGEVSIGSPQTRSVIKFNQDGSISIDCQGNMNINLNGNKLTVVGDMDVTGNTNLGSTLPGLAGIARIGDTVQVGVDTGVITSGSSTQSASN